MCGICGICGFSDSRLVRAMTDSLVHRGPDDEGYFNDGHASMGMRRLSIIDIKGGKQPVFNEEGNLCVIFNGEIYNYRELRKTLEERGHEFSTDCDTEVIVHAYEEYGKDCVRFFDGMFAFAAYNSDDKSLFLARDKLGIKPLYYFRDSNFFAFASEIKALFKIDSIPRKIDYKSVLQFAVLKYFLEERTFFENIWQLPAGSFCTISKDNFKIERYFEPALNPVNCNMEEQAKLLEKNLIESVRMQLNADVPVGFLLSGGVDSSLVAAMAAKIVGGVNTIIVSDNEDNEDVSYSKSVADSINSSHETHIVGGEDFFYKFPETMLHSEDLRASELGIIIEKARMKSKVVLTGEGADELFMGYECYKHHLARVNKKRAKMQSLGWDGELESYLDDSNTINGFQKNFLKSQLVNHHLLPYDSSSMRYSVELRVPYLCSPIISQSLSMGNSLKVDSDGITKAVVKKVALKYLPRHVVYRKKGKMPHNFLSIKLKQMKLCDGLIPDSYLKAHPMRKLLKSKYAILKYDLLNKIFVENDASIPKNFSLSDMY